MDNFVKASHLKRELQRFVTYYEKIRVKFCQGKYLTQCKRITVTFEGFLI